MEKPALTDKQIEEIDAMIAFRNELGMTQVTFAKAIGVSTTTISYVEQLRQPISVSMRSKILEYKATISGEEVSLQHIEAYIKSSYKTVADTDEVIQLIVQHIDGITKSPLLRNEKRKMEYLKFVERTLASVEYICSEVENEYSVALKKDLKPLLTNLNNTIVERRDKGMDNIRN